MIPFECIDIAIKTLGIFFVLVAVGGIGITIGQVMTSTSSRHDMIRRCQHKDKIYYKKGWKCLNCGYCKKT